MTYKEKSFLEELLELVKIVEHKMGNELLIKQKLEAIDIKYKTLEDKDNIWVILDQICNGITSEYFIMLEYLYTATKAQDVLNKQMEILAKGLREDSLEFFYALFYKWQFNARTFLSHSNKNLFINSSILHKELLNKLKQFLQLDLSILKSTERNTNRIVVSITQFLGAKHGPTRNALDYCYTLQKKLNKEVFLLVASEVPSDPHIAYHTNNGDYVYFNYNDSIEGDLCIDYLGEKIYGYQCKLKKENGDDIKKIISDIYEWKPYLIYNIGGDNLISNICGEFTKEVSIPCGYVFPITEAEYQILPRKIEVTEKDILSYLNHNGKNVIESIFVYRLEEPVNRLRKDDFGYSQESFVIAVVGNRLAKEINNEFIGILRKILELNVSVNVVFMGNFADFLEKQKIIGYEERVKYIGMQSDLRGAYNIVDLYLNPPRRGGGTSAVEALAEGVPVVSLPLCDVAYACGNDFTCESIDEIPNLVHRYMMDREFYVNQSKKAIIQAESVSDTESVLKTVLTMFED
jgi:glycosyltransferase involved in cell wall biosynthesis